jgi:glycosyltransferase EpsH
MQKGEMISIIVPVYNSEMYLSTCIDSLLSQTYQNFEILLIDDGSTDNSGEICEIYAQKDKRIRVYHQKNSGVSRARNVGLSHAIGKWIVFCDSDDAFFPNSLMILINKAQIRNDIEMVIAGYSIYDDNNTLVYQMDNHEDIIQDRDMGLMMMFKPLYCNYHGYICSKLYLRKIIEQNRICFDESIYFNEDRLFTTQYISHVCGNIVYSTHPVYKYYQRDGVGAMASLNNKFNYKFVTDFDACVLMYNSIKRTTSDKQLLQMSRQGILTSYFWIRRMMNQYGIKNFKLNCHFVFKMVLAGCYWYRLRKKIENLF